MGKRLSGDVDLFTDWQRRADFPAAVDAILHAPGKAGHAVTVVIRTDTFARLMLTAPHAPPGTEPDKLELSADWRAHQPVRLAIGPVLHPDDAVATHSGRTSSSPSSTPNVTRCGVADALHRSADRVASGPRFGRQPGVRMGRAGNASRGGWELPA